MKKFCAWLFVVAMMSVCLCLPVITAAESVEPRVGIAGYGSVYTNGNYGTTLAVAVDPFLTSNKISVKTEGFADDAQIIVAVRASDNVDMLGGELNITGNQYRQNIRLTWPLTKQTYYVDIYVIGTQYSNAQVQVWFF